jgi:hypothetical protein
MSTKLLLPDVLKQREPLGSPARFCRPQQVVSAQFVPSGNLLTRWLLPVVLCGWAVSASLLLPPVATTLTHILVQHLIDIPRVGVLEVPVSGMQQQTVCISMQQIYHSNEHIMNIAEDREVSHC